MSDLTLDWEWDDSYDRVRAALTTPDGRHLRATVERDQYADAPDYDFGCPVFQVERRNYGPAVAGFPECGRDSWEHDGLPHDVGEIWSRMADLVPVARRADRYVDTVDLVDRYLRIFHGGSAKLISSTYDRGGDDFLVYDTRAMRESWGLTGEALETSDPSAEEWQAYIDGEVYTIEVEVLEDAATKRREALRQAFIDHAEVRYHSWRALYSDYSLDDAVEAVMELDGEPEPEWGMIDGPVGGYYGEKHTLLAAEGELLATADYFTHRHAA